MRRTTKIRIASISAIAITMLSGCAATGVMDSPIAAGGEPAQLTPVSQTHPDLIGLPPPKGKITAAVYNFRDQTGQYKPAPDSSFSTMVTQGAASMLVKALIDSNWFVPVEREGLQDLLTERKIIRAAQSNMDASPEITALLPSHVLLEGGIVAYETNVRTGGAGAKYFGIGAFDEYRTDQVTVNLRAVDVRTGQVLNSVFTTKTVYSMLLDIGVFRFIKFKRLLEVEAGFSQNEPTQLCVRDAVESAVTHLIVQGIKDGTWALRDPQDMNSPIIQAYLAEQRGQLARLP